MSNFSVLFLARRYPPSVGGMEQFAFDLSNTLEKQIKLSRIVWGGSNKWLPVVLPTFFLRACWYLTFHPSTNLIHVQDAVQAPLGWLLHIIFRKPYIVVAHGLDITYKKKIYQQLILPFVRRADMVVSISTATKIEAEQRGVSPNKSTVITLGTHKDQSKPVSNRSNLSKKINIKLDDDKVILLTTGRLVKRKGVAWFINSALPALVKKYPHLVYLVAGEGSERSSIEEAIKASNTKKHVHLLGRVSDVTRELLYGSSDVFVMPNIAVAGDMEGFGIVAHEAATAQLPVVASNLEGIADAIHSGKNGRLIEPESDKQYIDTIDRLVASRDLRRRLGLAARRYTLRTFSWEQIGTQYINIYKKVGRK